MAGIVLPIYMFMVKLKFVLYRFRLLIIITNSGFDIFEYSESIFKCIMGKVPCEHYWRLEKGFESIA